MHNAQSNLVSQYIIREKAKAFDNRSGASMLFFKAVSLTVSFTILIALDFATGVFAVSNRESLFIHQYDLATGGELRIGISFGTKQPLEDTNDGENPHNSAHLQQQSLLKHEKNDVDASSLRSQGALVWLS